MKKGKRFLALLLSFAMVVTLLPAQVALADGGGSSEAGSSSLGSGSPDDGGPLPEKLAYFSFDSDVTDGDNAKATVDGSNATISTENKKIGTGALSLSNNSWLKITNKNDDKNPLIGKTALTISYWSKVNDGKWAYFIKYKDAQNVQSGNTYDLGYIAIMDEKTQVTTQRFPKTTGRGSNGEIAAKSLTNDWRKVTVVLEENASTLYINGQLIGKTSNNNGLSLTETLIDGSIFNIGKATWGNGEYFGGLIDEFTVYDGALNTKQIQTLYYQDDPEAFNTIKASIKENGFIQSADSRSLGIGEVETIQVTDNVPESLVSMITYKSSDNTVASVDASGKITGIKSGTAKITASFEEAQKEITVTVKDAKEELTPTGSYTFEGSIDGASAITGTKNAATWLEAYSGDLSYDENGRNGKAIKITNDYGLKLKETNLGDNYTVSMWVKNESLQGENRSIFFLGASGKWLGLNSNDNGNGGVCKLWGQQSGSAYIYPLGDTMTVPNKKWTMLTLTQSSDKVSLYQDGKLIAAKEDVSVFDTMDGNDQIIALGTNPWSYQYDNKLQNSLFDDVYVYDTALDASQVATVYLKDANAESLGILGDNESINCIIKDLTLPKEVNGINLTWTSDTPEKITTEGEVKAQDGSEVTLTANASVPELDFTLEKTFKVKLAREVTVNYLDVKANASVKSEKLYLEEGKEYSYTDLAQIPEILATENAAYQYLKNDTDNNKLQITVGSTENTFTIAYQKMSLGKLDDPEDITVIEGNTPILPKTVGAIASPDDGTPAESGSTSAEEVKIDVPITWNDTPDITALKAGEHTINGNAGGKTASVKINVLECDEDIGTTEAKDGNPVSTYKLGKAYKGHIVAEYDIVVTNIAASNDMSMIYTDLADNNGNWTSASGPRLDFGKGGNNNVPFFRTQKGDGKGNGSGNYPAGSGSYTDTEGYVKTENEKTYRIRMEIDDETNGGLYKTYLTEENGKVTKLFEGTGCTFRGYTGNGIQNFMAVRGGFTITNHKIYWKSGYATKKIEIYVGNELKDTITSKEEAGKFTYTPESTYEIEGDENVYVLVPEKSGWTKEDGTVNTTLTESAETAAGETATYKVYYVKKANLGGLDTAIKKAEADKTSAEASKVYTDASVTALQEKITAAKAVQAKYTAEGVTEEKLQEDAAIKEVKDAIDSLSGVLVAKKVDELNSFLTAFYKLNDAVEGEDSDANKVTDSSGKGHDGVKSANVQLNRYNGAVLPGGRARENGILLPNDLEVSEKMTFSFWAYDRQGSKTNIFGIGSGTRLREEGHEQNVGTTAAHHFSIYIGGGNVSANGGDFGWSGPTGTGNAACAANEWHFITCVVDGTKVNLYVDGQQKTEGNIKVSIPTAWDQNAEERFAYIGNNVYSFNGDSDWKGNIKNFRIYNTSLADEQVKEIYDTELTLPMRLAVEDALKAINARTEKGEYLLDITGEGTEADINLVTKGNQNETITWTAYAADGTTESSDVIDVATKKVKLPQTIGEPANAVLKAVITLGEETKTITIKCTATKVANLNRTAFNTAIDKADNMDESKYTSSSWAAFVTLRTNARTNAAKATTQDALDAITADLNNAMKADGSEGSVLVLLGDKTALNASIDNAVAVKDGRNQDDYTGTYKSAWDTLEAKLTAANTAKESNDVDEAAVTQAKNELDSAVAAFVNVTLDMKLAAANAAKDGKDEGSYTEGVWKALTDAIEKAESLKDNAEATQEQKLAACDELDAAIADFVEINKEAADKLKQEAADKLEAAKANKANYDEDVWNALEKAIEDYENLGADASKADLIAAYNRINVALANFKPISKEVVAGLKNEASDMLTAAEANKADYDSAVWKALEDAITAADSLKANATQTQITKAYTDLKTAMANFKPKEAATITGVTVTPSTLSLKEGGSALLTATVTYSDGTTNNNVTWSSNNTAAATVVNGNVTAVKAGTATITAEAGGISASCTVTVTADNSNNNNNPPAPTPKVTKVTLNKTKLTLGIKENFTLKATSAPADAVQSVTWAVDKKGSKIVTLNKKTGKVTGKKKGKATVTVTVTSKDGSQITKKCTVTVKPAPTKKTKISVKKSITVKAKKSTTLKPKVKGNFGCNTFKFTSKNKKVAKVDANGKVTGVKKGKTTITVTTYNKKAKTTVKVTVK